MAIKNKTIHNPYTGQSIKFLQTGADTAGQLLEMESAYQAHSTEPPPHYHPFQTEDFTVQEGELSVRIDGQVRVLRAGDTLHIPQNTVHSMWNNSDAFVVVNWKVRPAMNTEYLLETGMGLANDRKTKADGTPGLLQSALLLRQFSGVYRPAGPPFAVLRVVIGVLAPVARLLGYRATYGEYLD